LAGSGTQIVLFLRGDSAQVGVKEDDRIVTADGKRLKIDERNVLARGPDPGPGQPREAARRWAKKLEEMAATFAVPEIWELLEGSGEMGPDEVALAWFGEDPGFEDRAAILMAILADRVHFRRLKNRISPEPKELVFSKLARQRDIERKEGRIESLVASLGGGLDAGVVPAGVQPRDWEKFLEGLRSVAIHGPEAAGAAEVVEILRRASVNPVYGPFDLLVDAGVFGPDENLDLHRHGIRESFDEAVLGEARRVVEDLARPERWRSGRDDATSLGAVTIDSKYTVEVDDALSVRVLDDGWELGVHIADVAALVEPDSLLWAEGCLRAATLYMPEGSIPMLPPSLGQGGFSLDEGLERPAMSLFAEVGRDGRVRGFRFARTVLRVARRLDYEAVDRLIDDADPVLVQMLEAARALHAARIAGGAIDLQLPELSVRIDEAGGIHVTVSRTTTRSQLLVSECAILYNTLAGKLIRGAGVAGIFRTQPAPDEDLPDTLAGGPAAELAARRLLSPGVTGPQGGKHFTLGVEDYTLATSPIRRCTDLVMQHQIGCIAGQGEALDAAGLDRVMLGVGPAAEAINRIERNRKRYWLLRYLEKHVTGTLVTGVVVDRMGDRILVHLPDFALEAPLRTRDPGSFTLGEQLDVRLDRASAVRDTVRISLVG
jgi:exoribonuclease-2